MIKIEAECSITELGKRNNNEDFCAFIPGITYIVCDGVGGSEKGEIASNSVVKTFVENYSKHPNADVAVVLQNAERNLTDYINQNPSALGMATTLTFCQVKDEGVLVAWVGDSRVYQFRNGEIVFSTTDHSWVNEAIRSGIITADEGINHPKSNVITRAVQGNHKPAQADSVLLTDIKKGDLFMLCSDGVLESWNDNDLKALFATHNQVETLTDNLKAECSKNSRDNFTAIVFKIKDANIINTSPPKINIQEKKNESFVANNQTIAKKKNSISGILKMRIPISVVLILIVIAGILFFILSPSKTKAEPEKLVNTNSTNNNTGSNIDQNKKDENKVNETEEEKVNESPESNDSKSELDGKTNVENDKSKVENVKEKEQNKTSEPPKEKKETNTKKEEKAQKKSDSKNKPN